MSLPRFRVYRVLWMYPFMPGYDVESWHNIIEVIFAILNAIYYKKLILKNRVPFFSPQSLVQDVFKNWALYVCTSQ